MLIIEKKSGADKLDMLDEMVSCLNRYEIGMPYIYMLQEEATKQSNKEKIGNSYYYLAEYYFQVRANADSALYYLDKIEVFDFQDYTRYPDKLYFAIHLANKEFNLALIRVKEKLESKSINKNSMEEVMLYVELSAAHKGLKNYKESLKTSLKGLDILEGIDHKNDFDLHQAMVHSRFYLLYSAVNNYHYFKEYDKAFNYIDSLFSTQEEMRILYNNASPEHLTNLEQSRRILNCRVGLYLETGDLEKARKDLDTLRHYSKILLKNKEMITYFLKESEYQYQIENYNKALAVLNELAEFKDLSNFEDIDVNILKARIYNKLNRNAEAYALLDEITLRKDSIYDRDLVSATNEMQTIYEVNKLQSQLIEKEHKIERSRLIFIGLFAIVLLLLIIIVIIRLEKKEKLEKAKKIYEQNQLMRSYIDEIKLQKKTEEDCLDGELSLMSQILNYLEESQAFKDSKLTREDVALGVGVNRQYLIDAIRAEADMSFNDFINSMRLEFAHDTLITNKETPVKNIYLESGFVSRSTFNRLFKDEYGMTPNELRAVILEKEQALGID